MEFCKVKNVKSPQRAYASAGYDFFIPEDLTKFELERKPFERTEYRFNDGVLDEICIYPNGRCLIPSGIHIKLNPGTAMVLMNKSGVAANKGIVVGSCVIDQDYSGEIHLSLINTTNHMVSIKPGEKIVQGLILNVNQSNPTEARSLEDLYKDFESERNTGGFGSTGVN